MEREASLCNLKLHAARFRIAVGQLTDRGEVVAVRGQPVLQVGVVGTDMDKGDFLVKPNIGGLFLLCKSCFHKLSFLLSVILFYDAGNAAACTFRLARYSFE